MGQFDEKDGHGLQDDFHAGDNLLKNGGSKVTQFEDIMEAIGYFGYFQKRYNWIFNMVMIALLGMPYFNLVLAVSVPGHHCHVPGQNETDYTLEEWQNKMLPQEVNPLTTLEAASTCKMYTNGNDTGSCMYGYDYDTTWFTSTAASQEDWVCDKELYVTNTFVASRVGEIIGLFVFGQLGDRMGRKPVFFISLAFLIIGRISMIFASFSYHLFLATIIVAGFSSVTIFQAPLVIGLEITADDKRALMAFTQCIGWVIGSCTMPLIMWVVGDWKIMVAITTMPCAIAFTLFTMMPESPRWLASRGRADDAIKVLEYIARVNNKKLPANTEAIIGKIADKKEKIYGFPSLFANARIAKNTILIVTCWVVCAVSYFSLVLNIANMSGNPFLNFFFQSLVELPGYVMGRYFSDKFGRRWTHSCSYIIVTIFCGAVIGLHGSEPLVVTVLVTLVKLSFTVTFYLVWLQAMEVYPTCVRQSGTAIGSLVATMFGLLGPYIVYLGTSVDGRLPYVLLLFLAILGFICSTLLPETLNKKLPESLDDAKTFGKDQKFWSLNLNKE